MFNRVPEGSIRHPAHIASSTPPDVQPPSPKSGIVGESSDEMRAGDAQLSRSSSASFRARLSRGSAAGVHSPSPEPVIGEAEILRHINEMDSNLSSYEEKFLQSSSSLDDDKKEKIKTRIAETGMTLEELADVHNDGETPPPSRQILKTSEGGVTKGLLSVEIAPAHEDGPPAFWINYMVTAADSKGHGKSLLLAALNCSEKEGFGGKLHVLSVYDESDNFYKKFGFKGEQNPLVLDPKESPEVYKKAGDSWTFR